MPGTACVDYRLGRLNEMTNVSLYPAKAGSSADEIIDLGADHVVLATGARWTNDALFADGDPGRRSTIRTS